MSSEDDRTVWVGNLHDRTEEEILYELFLQAGPLQYVRLPRDKATGKKKNFAFICYRHECSVPYAIELMDNIQLYGRSLRVQSRHLKDMQSQGLMPYGAGGIHSLNSLEETKSAPRAQTCSQQAGLLPQPPSLIDSIPAHLLSNIPPHYLALAQQQMAAINANQTPLSSNPTLNTRLTPRDDRYGSINYGANRPNSSGYEHQRYDRYQNNRGQGGRAIDNKTMQAIKSRFEDKDLVSQNSHMLARLQERHGHFDKNRLGSSYNDDRHQYERDGSGRSHNRDHRQQPYSRHESNHGRNHERHSSYDNSRRHNDRNSGGYQDRNSYNRGQYNSHSRR